MCNIKTNLKITLRSPVHVVCAWLCEHGYPRTPAIAPTEVWSLDMTIPPTVPMFCPLYCPSFSWLEMLCLTVCGPDCIVLPLHERRDWLEVPLAWEFPASFSWSVFGQFRENVTFWRDTCLNHTLHAQINFSNIVFKINSTVYSPKCAIHNVSSV